MNKEYLLLEDNYVVVEDEKGNKRILKYQDNIDELLMQENFIEILENKILLIESENQKVSKTKDDTKNNIPLPILRGILCCATIPTILPYIITNLSNPVIDTIVGPMKVYTLYGAVYSLILIPFCGLISISVYQDYKTFQKEQKGFETELSFLKKILYEEKERLIELKNTKTNNGNNLFKKLESIPIIEPEDVKILTEHLELYYDCGYNEKKYLKLYKKGKLSDRLKYKYNDYGIDLVKKYIEDRSK